MIILEDARWSRFCGGLLGYINEYYCKFIKTDYEIELNMKHEDIIPIWDINWIIDILDILNTGE